MHMFPGMAIEQPMAIYVVVGDKLGVQDLGLPVRGKKGYCSLLNSASVSTLLAGEDPVRLSIRMCMCIYVCACAHMTSASLTCSQECNFLWLCPLCRTLNQWLPHGSF